MKPEITDIIDSLVNDGHLPFDDPRTKALRDALVALDRLVKACPFFPAGSDERYFCGKARDAVAAVLRAA